MKKIILSLALFGAMTNVSAEMVAPGVEMTSHQTWTTGNASGHVEDSNDVFFSSASARASVSSFYRENLSKYIHEWTPLLFNAEYIKGNKTVQCCDEVVRRH